MINLIHRILCLELAIALGAFYRGVGGIVVLRDRVSI